MERYNGWESSYEFSNANLEGIIMNKKTVVALAVFIALLSGVASAAPLIDYSAGKTSIDLNWRNTELTGEYSGVKETFGKKSSIDWGITSGLGNNFAIQYRQFNPESETISGPITIRGINATITANGKLDIQEFNILYKIDKNIAVYTGIMKTKANVNCTLTAIGYHPNNRSLSSDSKNIWQIGVVGSTKLAEKTTGYASLAAGRGLSAWELGISQEVTPNIDFNISYREIKVNKNNGGDFVSSDVDATAKGFAYGVSYKF